MLSLGVAIGYVRTSTMGTDTVERWRSLTLRPPIAVTPAKWRDIAEQTRQSSLPIVVRDLFVSQSQSWSPQRLADEWATRDVTVVVDLPPHSVPFREQYNDYRRQMKLVDFIALLASGRSCYLHQVALGLFPELQKEVDVKDLSLGRLFGVNLWVGSKTRSGLHYDNADNLFGQIYGRKRALLISPDYTKCLYPFVDNPSKSRVDLDALDLVRHPRCRRVELWHVELEPGDGLFIPRGWWHHISAEDVSISINCWHGNTFSDLDKVHLFLKGGAPVVCRGIYDFLWHGVLRRPYYVRLFCPPPPGVQAYDMLKALVR